MRVIDDNERRTRFARRQALAPGAHASTPVEAAEAVVALHGSDPATTYLSVLSRAPSLTLDDVGSALHDERSLVRVLAMRRTVFAVRRDRALTCLAATRPVAVEERRKVLKAFADAGLADPGRHLADVEREALAVFADRSEVVTADLAAASELLASSVTIGTGKWATEISMASRALLLLAIDGHVVRGRPRGGWTSSQFTWVRADRWSPHLAALPGASAADADRAAAELAEAWLRRHGPATLEDLQWWTGWTKTRTRAVLAALALEEVETSAGAAVVLAGDADPDPDVEPWVALLPGLDPALMTYRRRDHLLGPHRERLFDTNGNAGPSVWFDGRVVGGWAQRDDGEVVVELFEDVGSEASSAIDQRAASLQEVLGDVRLKARARRWTPVELSLRA